LLVEEVMFNMQIFREVESRNVESTGTECTEQEGMNRKCRNYQ